jgi:2-oxo-4-hydroxy-4-carboxy--5-ureidoimidazoline (OHCU) decarboxylase
MIPPSNVLLNWINELSARRDALILSIEKISDNEKRLELIDEAYNIGGQIAKAKDMLADINREITNSRGYR